MCSGRTSVLVAGLFAWLAAGSGGPVSAAEPDGPPAWTDHPKSDDSIFLYRVGFAEGKPDKGAAQQAAYQNALSVIVNEMLARAGVEEALRPEVAANLPVRNAEIVPGAVYTQTKPAGVACWVQVSYPLAEKGKLLEQIEPQKKIALERTAFDRGIVARLAEARSAHARGEYESALTNLQAVIQNYHRLRVPPFALQEAQILQGDAYGGRKDFLAARQCYEEVALNAPAARWKEEAEARLRTLPKAPRAWPLHDRLKGRKVALLCAVRDVGQAPRPFAPLGGALEKDIRDARLDSVDVTGEVKPDGIAALFDQRAPAAVGEAAKRKGAGVVLAVLLTTDPAKRGKTQDMMGVAMPVADSEIAFLVVDVNGATVCYGDRFSEVTGSRSEARLAERVASILMEKHLVPKCPALASAP